MKKIYGVKAGSTGIKLISFYLALICFAYFIFEFFYINRYMIMSVDDIWFAHLIYHYKHGLPYKDFAPYKTVLAYYFLVIPMFFKNDIIHTLISIKNLLAFFNTFLFFISAYWLTRFFSKVAVLCSLVIILFGYTNIVYSTEIRGDLIAYWFCFFSFLCLLEKRFILSGFMIGLGFCASQKVVWFIFASNIALGSSLFYLRDLRFNIINIAKFNFSSLVLISFYLIFWSVIASWQAVYHHVFYDAAIMFHLKWYAKAQYFWWAQILKSNPSLFLLAPTTLFSLMITTDADNKLYLRVFIFAYVFTMLCCLLPYQQIFPYYMQVTTFPFLLLYTAFFNWLYDFFKNIHAYKYLVSEFIITLLLLFNYAYVLFLLYYFKIASIYCLILLVPSIICFYSVRDAMFRAKMKRAFCSLTFTMILFLTTLYPATYLIKYISTMNGDYQRAHLAVINTLLDDGSDYVAGVEMIYDKNQRIEGLRHLIGPAVSYLYNPSLELKPLMGMASQYESPDVTPDSIIANLKHSNVKFFLNNYRTRALPGNIKIYISTHYLHYWGSIYLYAPVVLPTMKTIDLNFDNVYAVLATPDTKVTIDGKALVPSEEIFLSKGTHQIDCNKPIRLSYVPQQKNLYLDPQFEADTWQQLLTVG